MSSSSIALVLGLLTIAGAQLPIYKVTRPLCDSPEAEAAGLAAQDYLNGQHKNGYKYILNQIDDIKIITKSDGSETYKLEVDLLETTCHILDPSPLANCKVRPKVQTAVQGDCDLILAKVGEVLSVTAFKCKTEESTEDLCIGCATLLPLNDTAGLAIVAASLATFNNKTGPLFEIVEVGRMSSQVVSGGHRYLAEYVIGETNCTVDNNDNCVPLTGAVAKRGFCSMSGDLSSQITDCNIFGSALTPLLDTNATVAVPPPVVHVHTSNLHRVHGHRHHKLTSLHNPHLSDLLSAESAESGESAETVVPVVPVVPDVVVPVVSDVVVPVVPDVVVPVVPDIVVPVATEAAPVVVVDAAVGTETPVVAAVVKRDVPNPVGLVGNRPSIPPIPAKPRCPGKKKFF